MLRLVKTCWTLVFFSLHLTQSSIAQTNEDLSVIGEVIVQYSSRPDSCSKYLPRYDSLAQIIGDDYAIEKHKLYNGVCQIESGVYKDGMALLSEFLAIAEAKSMTIDMAFTYYKMAMDRSEQSDPQTNLNYINKAIDLYGQAQDQDMLCQSQIWKGVLLRKQRMYENATSVLDEAWESAVSINDSSLMAETLNAQAILLIVSTGDMKAAAALFDKQSDINRKVNDLEGLATSLGNLGFAHIRMNQLDLGEQYIREATEIKKRLGNPYEIAMANIQLSEINVLRKKWKGAEDYNDIAYDLAIAHNLQSVRQQAYQQRSYILQNQNKYEPALKYYKQYTELKDSLLNEKIVENSQKVEAAYDLLKKEEEINELEKADILKTARLSRQRLALVGSIIGLGLLSFLLYRIFGQKRQIESQNQIISTALIEKETLLKEIHHRVKNNMQVISSLLRIQTNQTTDQGALSALKEGQSRVQSMSLIHQDLYQHDNLIGIRMPDYIDKLSKSLLQTYQLSPDQVSITTQVDDMTLDVDTVVPMGLIINELITNSLKYAFADGRKGDIEVRLTEIGHQLELRVTDNGIGFNEADNSEGFGKGLIQAFARKLEAQMSIEGNDGTQVTLIIDEYKKV